MEALVFVFSTFLAISDRVGSQEPPNFAEFECELKKLALEFGGVRLGSISQVGNLEAALHFPSNCSHRMPMIGTKLKDHRLKSDQLAMALYVAKNGNDANPGSIDKPFATIQRARDAIRQLRHGTLSRPAVTVFVREGKYYFGETLTFNGADGGDTGTPVIYRAYPGETVILSGGVFLENIDWKPYKGNISMVKIPDDLQASFTSLFMNGKRQIRARFPNGNPQEQSGLCFSKAQYDGESCPGYLEAMGQVGSFQPPPSLQIHVDKPTRGGHVHGDDHFPSFQYNIGEPPFSDPNFGPVFSFWGNLYSRPNGVKYDPKTFTKNQWAHPGTGVVHMFHGGLWGNWMYEVENWYASNSTITFSRGGWQEARGSDIQTNHYFIENIFEELDAPGEWFLDANSSTLYFYPNDTQLKRLASNEFAAPVLKRLIAIEGSRDDPVRYIQFNGFHITETATTFLEPYEVPSGGDWSIHRGGAIFVDGAENIMIVNNTFDQVGGNGVFLSNYVKNCTVSGNEFRFTGDSAIAVVGSSSTIDAATTSAYPSGNMISCNHMHDIGVFGKQTSCYFQSLACGNSLIDNVCYNGPRAGFNFNDGFGGMNHLEGNLIFNMVRETGDHGPFNSWDRQPYVTPSFCNCGPPSIVPQPTNITRNFIINGYNGVWTLDHDDGSAYYNDSFNFLVYGGCKNYLGHDKACGPGNVIVYPGLGERSSGGRRCQTDDNGEFANQYYFDNQCYEADGQFYSFSHCSTSDLKDVVYQTWNNMFFSLNATWQINCGKQLSLSDWQNLGQDKRSVVKELPSPQDIVAEGRHVLGM